MRKLMSQVSLIVLCGTLIVVGSFEMAFAKPLDPSKDYDTARLEAEGQSPGAQNWLKSRWAATKVKVREWVGQFKSESTQPSSVAANRETANVPQGQAESKSRVPASDEVVGSSDSGGSGSVAVASGGGRASSAPTVGSSEEWLLPGMKKSEAGVPQFDVKVAQGVVPRLRLAREARLDSSRFALDRASETLLRERTFAPIASPARMTEAELKAIISTRAPSPQAAAELIKLAIKRGKVDTQNVDRIVLNLKPETEFKLGQFKALTPEEYRFLSGLLLFQQGNQCASALGLFHSISHDPKWRAEADYYFALCSKSLKLMTDFSDRSLRLIQTELKSGETHYTKLILKELDAQTPMITSGEWSQALEASLKKADVASALSPAQFGALAGLLAEGAAGAERFKTAVEWAQKVPKESPRYLQAKFVEALGRYNLGQKAEALAMQEELIQHPRAESEAREFQSLIALNLGRMAFQEGQFKRAHLAFLKVNKEHPLWLQGLSEMGWAQLMGSDLEGAIGNMHSIQSPFFSAAYKPESYVIRTIAYLQLCQYGDAYRALTTLEKDYRPILDKVDVYNKGVKLFRDGRYGTLKRYLAQPRETKDIDGLPTQVIRELARQRDFLNLQKSMNRQVDERGIYEVLGGDVERSLKQAQGEVTRLRTRVEEIRGRLASIKKKPSLEVHRLEWNAQLENELARLNDAFFSVDLFTEAKKASTVYQREFIAAADRRRDQIRDRIEFVLDNRLKKIRADLFRFLDNNELLRYEVFAASGENIRYQVAGGEKATRIPANVLPKSKSLQWDFDGEYWEDEIGHYRSGLKNNCPATRQQASN